MKEHLTKVSNGLALIVSWIILIFIGVMIGVVVSSFYIDAQLREEGYYDRVEVQHEALMQDEDYIYCPYCGEYLGE